MINKEDKKAELIYYCSFVNQKQKFYSLRLCRAISRYILLPIRYLANWRHKQ